MSVTQEEILRHACQARKAGHRVALATVTHTWGSSPRPVGSHLVVDDAGAFLGSVSGGCIEGAVIQEALECLSSGGFRLLDFGVSDEQAWEVGLACGGKVKVLVQPLPSCTDEVVAALQARQPVAMVTALTTGATGLWLQDGWRGDVALAPAVGADIAAATAADRSGTLAAEADLFVRAYAPAPRLIVVGAVHIAQALVPMAAQAGYEVIVIDPRRAFATDERFPGVRLNRDWPDEAMQALGCDTATAVVTLAHDPKLDDPALAAALHSPAFYIGALGSSRTHARRLQRLQDAGFDSAALARIHAPVGLDLGGRMPAEIAVSILAQILQVRYRGAP